MAPETVFLVRAARSVAGVVEECVSGDQAMSPVVTELPGG